LSLFIEPTHTMNITLDRLLEFIGNHWVMSSGLLIVTILLIQDFIESVFRKHKTVSPTEAVVLMNDDNTAVIDVREPHEYAEGHIEGARHIPLGKIEERAHELEAYRNKPVVVTCQSGTRSPAASRKLCALGFTQVFEMKGGMMAWEDQKLPISRKREKK
jgi:rhodanese-related sulfurtransferase